MIRLKSKIKSIVYICLGFLFTGLGAVGVLLPVLPTTPFLLLASFFFARGSKRFHQWFMGTKLYKEHLENFLKNRSMTLKTKIYLLTLATSMLLLSFYLAPLLPVRIFILLVMCYLYYYFAFRIRTLKSKEDTED